MEEVNTELTEREDENFEAQSWWSMDVSINANRIIGANILDMYGVPAILEIVKDPMHHDKELRELSRAIYSSNGIVTNAIDYCVALPTLSRVIVPFGARKNMNDTNKKLVEDILYTIRDKEIMRDIIHNALVEGMYFAYFETSVRPLSSDTSIDDYTVSTIEEINESNLNMSVVYLDPDYTRIVGISNGTYILAFDLEYFRMSGMEPAERKIRKYPEEIRKGWSRYIAGKGKRWLVLDKNHTIAVKFRAKKSEPYGRPFVLAAIDDILYDNYYTKAKRKAIDDSNDRIIYQTFPEGKAKGEAALTKAQQQQQHETVKNGITGNKRSSSTRFFSVAAGTKLDTLKSDIEILKETDDNRSKNAISTSLGFAGSLLSGEGTSSYSSQANNLLLITAEIFNIIELASYELNKVINSCVIKNKRARVEVQYLPITYANKKEFAGMAKELYTQGKGPLSLWASAVGVTPEAFFCMLDEELESDVENRYPVHKSSYTQTATGEAGRPVDEDTTNDNTIRNRNYQYGDSTATE